MAVSPSSTPQLPQKLVALRACLRSMGRLLVAYSGGIDSAFLAWVAHRELGDDMLAVLADSPSLARFQMQDAVAFAEQQAIPLTIVETKEMDRPEYRHNDQARCFHCKDELFAAMRGYAARHNFDAIAYGFNVDDQGDYRPGQIAAQQHGIARPLLDAGLTKGEIRQLARDAGLRLWDKPASPCLSSRIEYGRPVTPEALSAVEAGEDTLRQMGFREFRVRHHGDIVRIEISPDEMPRALTPDMAAEMTRVFRALGFKYVTLDLEGFRSGSMNALLPADSLIRGWP